MGFPRNGLAGPRGQTSDPQSKAARPLVAPRQPKQKRLTQAEGFQFGRADYHWQHEPCLYGWREGHVFLGPRNQFTVWQVPRESDHEHPTTKPVRLWEIPAENHLGLGGVLLDPFLGSGTAVIAAERTGRTAYGLEFEPRYCDVILARWEAFTGETAERVDA
jgi:DNA modification methylase